MSCSTSKKPKLPNAMAVERLFSIPCRTYVFSIDVPSRGLFSRGLFKGLLVLNMRAEPEKPALMIKPLVEEISSSVNTKHCTKQLCSKMS